MLLHINKFATTIHNEGICEIIGQLVICTYMIGQHAKAKMYNNMYNKYKGTNTLQIAILTL